MTPTSLSVPKSPARSCLVLSAEDHTRPPHWQGGTNPWPGRDVGLPRILSISHPPIASTSYQNFLIAGGERCRVEVLRGSS